MKLRIEGTSDEIDWLVKSLEQTYSIANKSRLYQNRDKTTCRCYLEIHSYFRRSSPANTEPSTLEKEDSEANPKPWDVVLGGNGE